jgi:hypothetical protein
MELATLERAQADVSKTLSEAASSLSQSLGNAEGVAQVGSIVVVQYKNPDGELRKLITELTQEQMELIMNNRRLMKEPKELARC